MKLSNNFSLKEMVKSQTAERKGINNNPSEDHMNNLKLLCENVLQPVRDHFGKVVSVSSGYRSEALCEAIGSSKNSQHAKGQAADFEIFDVSEVPGLFRSSRRLVGFMSAKFSPNLTG